jgi:hypothetical protein
VVRSEVYRSGFRGLSLSVLSASLQVEAVINGGDLPCKRSVAGSALG